jgi:exodeoxyribonuclease V
MLIKHIAAGIISELGYQPTIQQENAAGGLAEFILDEAPDKIYLLKGYAGTGKTTLIAALVKTLDKFKIQTVLMAPTGRAAKVLSSYAEKPAYTIHKKIYRQRSSKDGFGIFDLAKNLSSNAVFIVDEASMISIQSAEASIFGTGNLLGDLLEFVYSGKNCRLILTGDSAQLPPVGYTESPALDAKVLGNFRYNVTEHFLSEIVRQEANSGILVNATEIRQKIEYGMAFIPKISIDSFPDVQRISGNELIEELNNCYETTGLNETIVVCRSNKAANTYNNGIRNRILGREEEISQGDLMMVVKNNYFWTENDETINFIANGEIAEIVKIHKYEELYEFRFADVTLRFPDYDDYEIKVKILLDALNITTASLDGESNKKLFYNILEDYAGEKTKKKKFEKVRSNPHFNALQVKFAYAVTCHKAQGGQWRRVFVDQGFIKDEMINKEYLRWLYTAFTRATEKIYLVNFGNQFFINP